jgi:membrane-bound lytic murein transglycosylase D
MRSEITPEDRPGSTSRDRTGRGAPDWEKCAPTRPTPRRRRPTLAPVQGVFAGVVAVAAVLVLLASGEVGSAEDPEPRAPFPVADAAAALVDTRLPMEVNERVEWWVRRFLGSDRESFEEYLVREGLYGGMIRDRLRRRSMPEELLYLAMIESGFSPSATSPVAASGVWQFMPGTARAYGLTVDAWVDERRDPLRATDAALDYLEELHEMFGSWYLAAAAYNAGPGRVQEALRRAGSPAVEQAEEELYWTIIEHLPRETRQYVPKLLAAALLAEQAEHWGFEVEPSLPYLFDQVLVPAGTPLFEIAGALEISASLMRELNPHLIRGTTPPDRSVLVRVPLGESQRVVANLNGARRTDGS